MANFLIGLAKIANFVLLLAKTKAAILMQNFSI